ncbi:MAG TPA: hypothetical protein VNJ01_10100 [Bacteriovoracaceae bacterium]|nr:hypothetical protein [Bacteriovoracaceae bacterium]
MKFLLPLALICSFPVWSKYDTEFSGNVETQGRFTWNNEMAKSDLLQDWKKGDFYLIYGNLSGKLNFDQSRVEANWFLRGSASELYTPQESPLGDRPPYFVTQIFTYPNKLVARDLFNLQYENRDGVFKAESVLNKFLYEYDIGNHRITVGRMYINYGQGEIFNPINPFNQPTGLTAISQVAQGNDGIAVDYFFNDKFSLDLFVLGDKRIHGYDGEVSRTLWAHGEIQASDDLQLDFVFGEDQNRHKAGGQYSYRLGESILFAQILYQSEYLDATPSNSLFDGLLAYDRQLTSKWHVRFEGGYQQKNKFATLSNLGERFLPTEYFLALANQYEIHPLVKLNGTAINDVKSGFTYLIAKIALDLGRDMELDLFGFVPVSKGDEADNVAQKLVTTDIGFALRKFF